MRYDAQTSATRKMRSSLPLHLQLTAAVSHLEVLCKQLYESQSASERSEAEKALVTFQNAPDGLVKCQALLERANSPYSQLLATTTLTKLVSRTAQVLSLQQRIDIRKSYVPWLPFLKRMRRELICRIHLESLVILNPVCWRLGVNTTRRNIWTNPHSMYETEHIVGMSALINHFLSLSLSRQLCAAVPLLAAEAGDVRGAGPRHPLRAHHQARLVRLIEGDGELRLPQRHRRRHQVPPGSTNIPRDQIDCTVNFVDGFLRVPLVYQPALPWAPLPRQSWRNLIKQSAESRC